MNIVNDWAQNDSDKRNARIIFDEIKKRGSNDSAAAYIFCLIVLDSRINTFAKFKAFELIKLLVTLPHLSYGLELRLQKGHLYNPLVKYAIKNYGLPPDTNYYSDDRSKKHWISKL